MIRRMIAIVFVTLISLSALSGCGGAGETGKNKDYDRPSAPRGVDQ